MALAFFFVLAFMLAGCGDGGGGSEEAGAKVVMELIALKPEKLEVPVGTTVTWTQKDAGVHTVTSGTVEQGTGGVTPKADGKFDSGQIPTSKTFRFTFEDEGTFTYFCAVHPATMRGEVRVR